MLRLVGILLAVVVLISILRMVIGVVMKAAADFLSPPKSSGAPASASAVKAGGELKRDPVCGTYIPVETSVKKTVNGEVLHFCSAACRDQHRPA